MSHPCRLDASPSVKDNKQAQPVEFTTVEVPRTVKKPQHRTVVETNALLSNASCPDSEVAAKNGLGEVVKRCPRTGGMGDGVLFAWQPSP